MRITRIQIHHLRAPLRERFGWSLGWTNQRSGTLVEVSTDEGLTGWGDGGDFETLRTRASEIIGRSPLELAGIHDALREPPRQQSRTGGFRCGGFDMALWDLAGQAVGMPVCRLLGEVRRTAVQPYCTAMYRKDWADLATGMAEEAVEWQRLGYSIIKMKIGFGVETDLRIVAAVRQALGPATGLAVDSNCAYDAGTAARLGRRLEPFDLMWWEEPVLATDHEGYRRLRDAIRIPLAGGETGTTDQLAKHYVAPGLVDILQPELEITGLTGARILAHLCWLHRIRLVPHNWGTAVRTAAVLHLMATLPALTEAPGAPAPLFEFDQTEHPYRDAVVSERIAPGPDGLVPVPSKPGLGVTVVREAVAEFRERLEVLGA